ncbi:MAG: 2-amino-4-hydroxy-6-hydroxymethyldihydropteridine diphosphokinase [Candidimonas sp.]|nr:MAG: 2-amino-4-hydroxy-6-hydroxymethyldihydropteridine diphosphokinase [Candidimonas sp.]
MTGAPNEGEATAYIGLGANLGDAAATVRGAAKRIAALPGLANFRLSPLYRTAPIDSTGPDYINAVASVRAVLSPFELLAALQRIEHAYGRARPYPNAPRTLDLDLLLYGSETIHDPDLVVPHPRMHLRAFVLRPLLDLNPDLQLEQGSVTSLLARHGDQRIQPLATPRVEPGRSS